MLGLTCNPRRSLGGNAGRNSTSSKVAVGKIGRLEAKMGREEARKDVHEHMNSSSRLLACKNDNTEVTKQYSALFMGNLLTSVFPQKNYEGKTSEIAFSKFRVPDLHPFIHSFRPSYI